MNKIITIGREFGSGGRELGKRLAELLDIAYYDKEIIEEIAKRTQLAESYVQQIVEHHTGVFFPITIGRSMHTVSNDYIMKQYAAVYAEQTNVLREMAERSDCVIVGRCADHILKDYRPVRIFVYADEASKLRRCRDKANDHDDMSDSDLLKIIRKIDKNRAKYYRHYTEKVWGERTNYDICINTSNMSVKTAAEALAHLLQYNKNNPKEETTP